MPRFVFRQSTRSERSITKKVHNRVPDGVCEQRLHRAVAFVPKTEVAALLQQSGLFQR